MKFSKSWVMEWVQLPPSSAASTPTQPASVSPPTSQPGAPMPSAKRAIMNPTIPRAIACPAAAKDHTMRQIV